MEKSNDFYLYLEPVSGSAVRGKEFIAAFFKRNPKARASRTTVGEICQDSCKALLTTPHGFASEEMFKDIRAAMSTSTDIRFKTSMVVHLKLEGGIVDELATRTWTSKFISGGNRTALTFSIRSSSPGKPPSKSEVLIEVSI
jgi:hypothetical protein